jgi:hypothetical protein
VRRLLRRRLLVVCCEEERVSVRLLLAPPVHRADCAPPATDRTCYLATLAHESMSRTRPSHPCALGATKTYSCWRFLLLFLWVGPCHAYQISPPGDRSPPPATRQGRSPSSPSDRRSFLTAASSLALAALLAPPPAHAVEVVAPGERQAKELKGSKRIGGLAAKIRDVGDIMVGP